MSLRLRALIGAKGLLAPLAGGIPGGRVADLTEALGIIVLGPGVAADPPSATLPGLMLSKELARRAQAASDAGTLAFVEADYHPGRDFQSSVVWAGGSVALGPLNDKKPWDPREPAMKERPINTALRALGVKAEGYGDEWDAVALSRHAAA